MNTNFFSTSATETLRKDLRALADDAARLAQTRVMDPAKSAIRHARDAATHTRDVMLDQAVQAEHYTAEQCDRIARQITSNPFKAVGVAFVSGLLIAACLGLGNGVHHARR